MFHPMDTDIEALSYRFDSFIFLPFFCVDALCGSLFRIFFVTKLLIYTLVKLHKTNQSI